MKKAVQLISSPIFNNSVRLASSSVPSGNPSYNETFKYSTLKIEKAEIGKPKPNMKDADAIKFGAQFSDHMMHADWNDKSGWEAAEIHPMRNLSLHPAAKVLHYAIELFEGMKAYRGSDSRVRLFRPEHNMARMNKTAARCALPTFDGDELIKIISEMVRIDKEWIPFSHLASLYIRPTLIGTEGTLGIGHTTQAKLFVLTGPAGAYYPTGFKPITLLADSQYVRAYPGGVGQYKMGCNYAPTVMVGKAATELGCQQVLWLSGEKEEVTEVGTMNLFVFWKNEDGVDELITSSLDKGIILPGVTRMSILDLARELGTVKVTERDFNMEELTRAIKEKRVHQMFGSGTACIISPVDNILHHNKKLNKYEKYHIPTMTSKYDLMDKLYTNILDIQYGRVIREEWTHIVC